MAGFLCLPSGVVLREDRILAILAHSVDWAHDDCTFFYHNVASAEPIVLMEVGNKQVVVTITKEDRDFLKQALAAHGENSESP